MLLLFFPHPSPPVVATTPSPAVLSAIENIVPSMNNIDEVTPELYSIERLGPTISSIEKE